MNDSREPFMPSVKDAELAATLLPHEFDLWDTVLSKEVWNKKYRALEASIYQTMSRTAHALFPSDPEKAVRVAELMYQGVLVPAGRIISGAGTGNRVTLMNCYVMGTMGDSLASIFETLSESALTMQMGGGIGVDFSPLRPHKARLKRTGSSSSGPLPFMDTWDAMCKTIMSAGHRRGAMMATMSIDHPNIVDFITAKHTKDRLKNFNVSVLVSDAFMQCLKEGGDWNLVHSSVHVDWSPEEKKSREQVRHWTEGKVGYDVVYRWETVPAAYLWNLIMKSSFEYSEPGVIFIDRINGLNNLRYVEDIRCTNPCGEQPLPPYGACDLGHLNLARLILNAYSSNAEMDWRTLIVAVDYMVALLDSVIDTTLYPLGAQEVEMKNKRRIGLGITGLADALSMVGLRYGSPEAVTWTTNVMKKIAVAAYEKSCDLAIEKGPAPTFDPRTFNWAFVDSLKNDGLKDKIKLHGLRNCVLLTVAPTGTTSAFYGNVSSGCEPNFAHRTTRNVRQPDDTYKQFTEYSYSVRYYAHVVGMSIEAAYEHIKKHPSHFPTIEDLTAEDHINIQAAVQKYVDASVSKTVNCPKDITFEKFKDVYLMAWNKGCKGCTTYRQSEVRGSILESADTPQEGATEELDEAQFGKTLHERPDGGSTYTFKGVDLGAPDTQRVGPSGSAAALAVEQTSKERPIALEGRTYKIKWPGLAAATYLTINHNDVGELQEVFISSKNSQYTERATALSVILSKHLKLTKDPIMVANELMQINLSMNPSWSGGRFYGSIIAQIGAHIKEHAEEFSDMEEMAKFSNEQFVVATIVSKTVQAGIAREHIDEGDPIVVGTTVQCTACGGFNVQMKEGCKTCIDCGQSDCN